MLFHYTRDQTKCKECFLCTKIIKCPSPISCIGCKSCYLGCPFESVQKIEYRDWKLIEININNESYFVPEDITVKSALEYLGFTVSRYPDKVDIFAPCETGGCYSCAVLANGSVSRSCHTSVKKDMKIKLKLPENYTPARIVGGFTPHTVGGVGTPYQLKGYQGYIEVACFASGCNFRCKTCQNFDITYDSSTSPMTPIDAATKLTIIRHRYNVDRMAISGGEATLNRKWLIEFFRNLREQNSDKNARFHLDTNASILTEDYIDDLIEVGVTDIGPDLKAFNVKTFIKITCLKDKELANKYLKTSWNAVKYIADNYYPEKVFMGVGLPYNKFFYENEDEMWDEIESWGQRLANINPNIQVCVLDYRPEFRKRYKHDLVTPTFEEMKKVKKTLEKTGLKCVTAQTRKGYLGPDD